MRGLLIPFAALAVALPGAAWADGGCPAKASVDVLTAFGTPAATLKGGQVIYQPTGVVMLGMPVSYVVVTKGTGDAVQEIDYRFAGLTRKYGQHFPMPVLQAFDKAYDGATCSEGRATSCSFGLDAKMAGDLNGAQINEAYIDLPAKADGALAMVKADFSSQTQGPVFLTCEYN